MSSFSIKRNDTAPPISATLTDKEGTAIDIENATVRFHMKSATTGVVKVDADADNDQTGDGSDGSTGKVSYDWAAADTASAGWFFAEWEVTFADSTVRTFPTNTFTSILIAGDIA